MLFIQVFTGFKGAISDLSYFSGVYGEYYQSS